MRQTMSLSIRLLLEADLENADAIFQSAFKSSESRLIDLHMYRKIQPDGWFLASQDGTPVGLVGTTNYAAFAYVGMMAVHPRAQRQGVGLALMRHLLAWLDKQRVPSVLLDASPAGQPLYEKLGFVAYNPVYVFQRRGGSPCHDRPPQVQAVSVRDLDELVQYDADVFGAARGRVLHALLTTFPERAFMLRGEGGQMMGYVIAQESRIGPWVMRRSHDAETLLRAALSLPYAGTVSVVVPEVNQEAVELLKRYGFETARVNRHMGRGSGAPPRQLRRVCGQTSLALG
jgi:ribosomal protein S18 acetylase RimI-like enzyme